MVLRDVDVVVLSLNRSKLTIECLRNLLEQIDVAPKIWLVDQGSNEIELDLITEFASREPNVSLIKLGRNIGVPAGRNLGFDLGSADTVVFIDNDAEFRSPRSLCEVDRFLSRDPSVAAVGFRIENFFSGTYDRGSWVYPRTQFERRNEAFIATRYCGAGHALRRSALGERVRYDESLFFYWEELDLSLQLLNSGRLIWYLPSIVVRHKVSPEARVTWNGRRYYFLVRNALYLNYKYYRSLWRLLTYSSGYLVKGVINRKTRQAIQGILHSLKMIYRNYPQFPDPLSSQSRRLIRKYETKVRGSLFERLKSEVFENLQEGR